MASNREKFTLQQTHQKLEQGKVSYQLLLREITTPQEPTRVVVQATNDPRTILNDNIHATNYIYIYGGKVATQIAK